MFYLQLFISIFSIVGSFLIGYKKQWIWKFAHIQNLFTALYFVYTNQYGFLIENFFYLLIFLNNQYQWNRKQLNG